jgi:choline-sulfatase
MTMPSDRPNIVVLMADTVRRDALGCYGSPTARTPHIDALAADACVFERMYQPANMCQPSRVSWMTGCYPSTHQVYTNGDENPRRCPTLLKMLHTHGYRGGYLGLFHCWPGFDRDGMGAWSWLDYYSDYPFAPDQDEAARRAEWNRHRAAMGVFGTEDHAKDYHHLAGYTDFPIERQSDRRLTERALACIDDFASDRPNLLWVSSWMPHEPWAPPAPFHEWHRAQDVVLPGNVFDQRDTRPTHQSHLRMGKVFDELTADGDAMLRRACAAYAGCMSFVDDNMGRILARLKSRGLYDDALVVFLTDHGTANGAHGWMHKGGSFMIDEISRVPCMIKLPRAKRAVRIPDIVASVDLHPTILDVLGIEHAPVDGRSLAGLMAGGTRAGARAFGQHRAGTDDRADAVRSLRTGRWKYNLYSQEGVDELYDMEADPLELRNLAREAPREREQLRAELVDFIRSSPDAFVVR